MCVYDYLSTSTLSPDFNSTVQWLSHAGITALTKEISNELLKSVTIYPDGYMDVKLNLVDEIQKLMEMLRRETSTA